MKFEEFQEVTLDIWNGYLQDIYRRLKFKQIVPVGSEALFPNTVLATETEEHFIYELFGLQREFENLRIKTHKESSTIKYLYQFNKDSKGPCIKLDDWVQLLSGLVLARDYDRVAIEERFGNNFFNRSAELRFTKGSGSTLRFGKKFNAIHLRNCLLINSFEGIYRIKKIFHMSIINKKLLKEEYKERVKWIFMNIWNSYFRQDEESDFKLDSPFCGVHFCKDQLTEGLVLASQFASLFLVPGLRETTIGEFIKSNPKFIKQAFSCEHFLYEPELRWIEGNPESTEKSINPDLLIQRDDGYFDICDLKTPELDAGKITTGQRRRRRFKAIVNEGLAQLANYEEYFEFKENQDLALSKYGIRVTNPKLILIIGNYENISDHEIKEASRMLKPNYKIIDYDTLNSLFLLSLEPKNNLI